MGCPVEFRILGPVEVWDESRLVDVGPRMPRAVLAMLLLDANRVVSQDRLIDGLWGDEPPAQATGTLQVYISNLRRVLERRQGRTRQPEVVVTRAPGYLLRVEPDGLDATRFEAAVAEGRATLAAGDPTQAREILRRALSWWRGAPYADVGLEAVVQAEAARLLELRAGACEALMEAELATGGHAGVVGELERLVNEEPLRERRSELFALALYRCGRQADALRAIANVRATLRNELGLEPGVTLRQLERDILQQAPLLDSPAPADAVLTERPGAGASTPAPFLSGANPGWPLVGRRAELAELERALDRSWGGRGGVVLVAGEPGVGKTRLATELVQRARVRGVPAAWGRCYEGEGAPAFWPWTQVLRMLIGDRDADALRSLAGPSAAELAHVVPELHDAFPDADWGVTEGQDPEQVRFRLYETVCRLVAALADHCPLLVVLDDLHWADPASLQLLGFAATQLAGCQVTIVGTYRDTEVDSSHPLGATLAALARHGATTVALRGLGRVEVGEFVTAATGVEPDSGLVRSLWDRTDGNPFFVGQLVRLLETRGGEAGLGKDVPGGIRDVIRHRVGLLPKDTAQVLRLAAVVGRDFDMDVLAQVVGGDEDDVLARVETALRAGLVIDQPEMVGRCRFVHALVRETLYDELSALRRARLHRRVGEALEDRGGADPLELAHHFWRAEPAGAAGKALEHVIRAADHAIGHLAYEQAEEQLRRALELVARLPEGADRSRLELDVQTRLWELLAPLRGYADPEVGRLAARARELCWALGNHAELVRPLWRLWAFDTVGARFEPAEEYARELLAAPGRDADPVALLGAHHGLGMVAMHRGRLTTARHHIEQALRQPSGSNPLVTEMFGLQGSAFLNSCMAVILSLLGEEAAARQTSQLGQAIATDVGHPYTLALTVVFDAWVGAFLRDLPLARRAGKAGGAACDEGRYPLWGASSKVIAGWARALQGEGPAGVAEATAALASWEATGARMLRTFFLGLVGEAHRAAGNSPEALVVIEAGLAEGELVGEHLYDAELHRLRGELLAELDPKRTAEAEASLREAITVAEGQGARLAARRAKESLERLAARIS
jgi:DNA-binding SARP family transcriptional activator